MIRILFASLLLAAASSTGAQTVEADAARLESRLAELSRFGATPEGGVNRVAYSDADIAARAWIMDVLRTLGLEPRIDPGGNILARRRGSEAGLPAILFGSHIDSVPHGGRFDGNAGVMAALEAMQLLEDHSIATRHPMEFVIFANEEGGLIGAKAFTGLLDEAALDEQTHAGVTIAEGMARLGGDPARLDEGVHRPGEYAAYIELHIEQGAVLDEAGEDIGVVQGIVGIDWWDVTVTGMANHGGTTPMPKRRDALVAASQLVLAVDRLIRSEPGAQVATVGRIAAHPGAPNVIPGRVEMSLEIRDLSNPRILHFFDLIEAESRHIAERTRTGIAFRKSPIHEIAAETDPRLRDVIERAARARGYTTRRMPSGAGHDAQAIAHIAPIGMIFVPSRGGISHAPEEFTSPEDLAQGSEVLLDTLLAIDRGTVD